VECESERVIVSVYKLVLRGGQLDILKWCRRSGCPWGPNIIFAAAYAGVYILLAL
jgi:hypothetical protein